MFTQKDPRKGSKAHTWHCEKLDKGKWFKAWKAAELFGVLCHWSFRSIPCYWELTDGKLDCPHCRDNPSLRWVGYLPLYKDSHRPVIVVVAEAVKPAVDKIEIGEPIHVWRDDQKGATVAVRPDGWGKKWQPPKGYSGPPDIRPWLLTLWKEVRLSDFFAQHGLGDANTAAAVDLPRTIGDPPQPPPSVVAAYANASPEMQAAVVEQRRAMAKKLGKSEPVGIGDVIGTALNRSPSVKDATVNGVHGK